MIPKVRASANMQAWVMALQLKISLKVESGHNSRGLWVKLGGSISAKEVTSTCELCSARRLLFQ